MAVTHFVVAGPDVLGSGPIQLDRAQLVTVAHPILYGSAYCYSPLVARLKVSLGRLGRRGALLAPASSPLLPPRPSPLCLSPVELGPRRSDPSHLGTSRPCPWSRGGPCTVEVRGRQWTVV